MTSTRITSSPTPEDLFGRAIAARLSAGADDLPRDISERLRASRTRALAQRKREMAPTLVVDSAGSAALGLQGWWQRALAVVPLLLLTIGLLTIGLTQEERRTAELAEVDAALLTDDLPPAAYTDPGFAQFLKANAAAAHQ
ncbi:DUF3619 family protein [uncultured Pseudacidovorax sp.]|uniref:DUF3619 family protein n=1 Tax=uncultured Pseudacidovorax sp. TaxID=679313 RepID=UPI0025E7E7B0|nr:DUF3619 family protein [uncultured Pseudacidovorax sp.]